MPRRLQRSRAKGWRMPVDTIYVGRPTRWRNPFAAGNIAIEPDSGAQIKVHDHAHAVTLYRQWLPGYLTENPRLLAPLKRKDLVFWCPLDGPCHADALLKWANDGR